MIKIKIKKPTKIVSLDNLLEPIKLNPKEHKEVYINKKFVDLVIVER